MWLLFELGIFFSRFVLRRGEASEEGSDPGYAVGASAPGGGGLASRASDDPPPGGDSPNSPPGEGIDVRSGGDSVVGREISGGDPFDNERFRPMTPEEMEAELDAIESEEDIEPPDEIAPDPVARKLERVMELRDDEDEAGARALLYEVLADGDDDQRRVARNILAQLDQP
jgi:sec-independent protein translocase protein TatC